MRKRIMLSSLLFGAAVAGALVAFGQSSPEHGPVIIQRGSIGSGGQRNAIFWRTDGEGGQRRDAELSAKIGPGEVSRAVPWSTLTAEQKKLQRAKMAIHAAMVSRMDAETGKIISRYKPWVNSTILWSYFCRTTAPVLNSSFAGTAMIPQRHSGLRGPISA